MALAAGGRAVGMIPRVLLQREIAQAGRSELHVVETMQERKTRMADLADGFIVVPGAAGTLDKFFERRDPGSTGCSRQAMQPSEREGLLLAADRTD